MKTISELKFRSKQKLIGKYGMTIMVSVIVAACNILLSLIVEMVVNPSGILSFAAYEVVVFLINLLLGMLVSGRTYIYMSIIYDRPAALADLKKGFTEHPEKAVLLQIPFSVAALISTLPINIYQLFFWETGDRDLLFVCMLISALGAVIEIFVELIFSQVFFLLHDFPDRSVGELFTASARLMKGHMWQYFLLLLSFLPWLMVSALLFFIPALFIISQMNAAEAAFYQSLTSQTSRQQNAPPNWQGAGY